MTEERVEALADQEHERWSHWMRYMFDQGQTDAFGNWTMPGTKYRRWARQMQTPYAELSEAEKESDRAEARKTLALLATLDAKPAPGIDWEERANTFEAGLRHELMPLIQSSGPSKRLLRELEQCIRRLLEEVRHA